MTIKSANCIVLWCAFIFPLDYCQVPWLDNFLDLAGPRFDGWQEASRDYARRFTGSSNPTRVKLRWDETFLYVAAELRSRWDLQG